jgi:alkylation response protein AidB-like acyl-CoA dehydrogenase
MDFSYSEVQSDLRDLTRQIVSQRATPERLKQLEAGDERVDRELWSELAAANLIGISLPEDVGGSGYGVMELGVVLGEIGRHVAPVPMLATVALAARTIAHWGSDELKQRLIPGVVNGLTFLAGALEEAAGADPRTPQTAATPDGDGWVLTGEKVAVPWGQLADHFLVSADAGLFVVPRDAAGLEALPATGTTDEPQAVLRLDGVRVAVHDAMVSPGAVRWAYEHGVAAVCATAVGVLGRAVEITATYITERQQFNRPIATFQGATLKAADTYIDLQAITVATQSALWRLSREAEAKTEPIRETKGAGSASDALAIAKYWVADAGQRIAYTCQHLHGGIGVDTDYPLHRYFKWAKEMETMFGAASAQLLQVAV